MVLAYTQVIAGASTNVITPSADEISQGNNRLTPYDSAINNGYYRQVSQGVANLSAEIINVLLAAGLTPGATNDQLIAAINLLVPDAALLPEAIAGTNNTKFLTPYLASNLPAFRIAKQTPQNLSNGVATKITGFTVDFNLGNYWNAGTSRYTPPAGTYQFNFVTNGTSNLNYGIAGFLYKNGSPTSYGQILGSDGLNNQKIGVSELLTSSGTDFWEVYVTMNGAGTLTLDEVFLSIFKIR